MNSGGPFCGEGSSELGVEGGSNPVRYSWSVTLKQAYPECKLTNMTYHEADEKGRTGMSLCGRRSYTDYCPRHSTYWQVGRAASVYEIELRKYNPAKQYEMRLECLSESGDLP